MRFLWSDLKEGVLSYRKDKTSGPVKLHPLVQRRPFKRQDCKFKTSVDRSSAILLPRSSPSAGQPVEELPVEFVVVLGRPHRKENVTSYELVDDLAVRRMALEDHVALFELDLVS